MLATAGGLLFTGQSDGRIMALNSSDGSVLWEFQTGAGLNAPVSTFEHNGEQHIIAYSAGRPLCEIASRRQRLAVLARRRPVDEARAEDFEPNVAEAVHQ